MCLQSLPSNLWNAELVLLTEANTKDACCKPWVHICPVSCSFSPMELFRSPDSSLASVSLARSSLSPCHVLLTGRIHSALCPLTTEGTLGICSTSTNMCSEFLLQYSICWLGLHCLSESSVSLPSTGMLNIRPRVIFSIQCYTWVGGFQIHYLFFSVLVSSSSQSASTSLVPKCLLAEPTL